MTIKRQKLPSQANEKEETNDKLKQFVFNPELVGGVGGGGGTNVAQIGLNQRLVRFSVVSKLIRKS